MTKIEQEDLDEMLKFAAKNGVSRVGMQVMMKSDNGPLVQKPDGSLANSVRTSAVLVLTAMTKPKAEPGEHLFYQQFIAEKLIIGEEDSKALDKSIEEAQAGVIKKVQELTKAEIFKGRTSP